MTTTHAAWCSAPTGPFADHDICFSEDVRVPASLYPDVAMVPEGVEPERFTLYVQQEPGSEAEVHLQRGDWAGYVMTADEARQVAAALVTMAETIERCIAYLEG